MDATARSDAGDSLVRRVISGVVGGLAGGVVFGVLMGAMGMLPMVAGLVGSESAAVGFGVHMVISAILGAGFGLVLGGLARSFGSGAVLGLLYGAVWWVLGPLLLMPLIMGMGPQFSAAFTTPVLMSLVGHLLYGVTTGLVYAAVAHRGVAATTT
jgi:uncharacterized membrane protein YagU involved in acid resistance